MTIRWSICMPTVPARRERRQAILDILEPQLEGQVEVEFLLFEDNRRRDYGQKMQALVDIARGTYISFVDDDDTIADDYVERILPHLNGSTDMVTFLIAVTIDDGPVKLAKYSHFYEPGEDDEFYYRGPSHLMPIRRQLVEQVRWDQCGHYEADSAWAKAMASHGLVRSEFALGGPPLYHYLASTDITEEYGVWLNPGDEPYEGGGDA